MNVFPFGPPEPPTPEQLAELAKRRVAVLGAVERKYHAVLPHLHEAKRNLREAAALGAGGGMFEEARRNLVLLIDDMETALVRPPT